MSSQVLLPKKLVTLCVLQILWEQTDEDHRMSQEQVRSLLLKRYDMQVDRKTVKRTLDLLEEFGFEIGFSERERQVAHTSEKVATDYYLVHSFSNVELCVMIDALVGQNALPEKQRNDLVRKIEALSSRHFQSSIKSIHSPEGSKRDLRSKANKQFFFFVDVLNEAIRNKRKVTITYGYYDVDGCLHTHRGEQGDDGALRLNPYQMMAANGRYYLSANVEGSEALRNFRVDRIMSVCLEEERVTPFANLAISSKAFQLPKHPNDQLYMFVAAPVTVRLKVVRGYMNYVFDWFSKDIRIENVTPTSAEIVVKANEQAMRYWAMQYADYVEVLEPISLREALLESAHQLVVRYSK